ncbi:unnamed protein product [Rotaria socialis]
MLKNPFLADENSSPSDDDEREIKIQTAKIFAKSYIISSDNGEENVQRIVRNENQKRQSYFQKPNKESLSDDEDQKETTWIKNKPENNGDLSPQQYYINLFLRKIDNQMKTTPNRATKECTHIELCTDQKPISTEDISKPKKLHKEEEILKKINDTISMRGKHTTNYHDQFNDWNMCREYVQKLIH